MHGTGRPSTGTIVAPLRKRCSQSRQGPVPRCPARRRYSIRVSPCSATHWRRKATPLLADPALPGSDAWLLPKPVPPRRGERGGGRWGCRAQYLQPLQVSRTGRGGRRDQPEPRGSTPLGGGRRLVTSTAGRRAPLGWTSVAGAIFLPVPWRSRRRPARDFFADPGGPQLDLQLADPEPAAGLHLRRRAQPGGRRPASPGSPGFVQARLCSTWVRSWSNSCSLMCSRRTGLLDAAGARQGLQHDGSRFDGPIAEPRQPLLAYGRPGGLASTHGTSPEEQRVGGRGTHEPAAPRTY